MVEKIWNTLEDNPGATIRMLAQSVGLDPRDVAGRLATLENSGYLISEDQYGQLYPFLRVET
jgi:DNA-binding Lrp family transcriptional regulator